MSWTRPRDKAEWTLDPTTLRQMIGAVVHSARNAPSTMSDDVIADKIFVALIEMQD